jgi:hypothetical protein
MSYAPFPSNDGSDQQDPARVTGLRLRDAQQIAASRLDSGGDGSLKNALADVIAKGAPRDDIERLTDRIGAAQANYVVPSDAPTLPFLAEGPNFGFGGEKGEKKEQTLAELPQWSEARATVAAELADMQSQPLFLQTDQQQLGGGTHWQPTERDAEPYHPVQQEPAQTFVAEAAPIAEPPHAEPPLPEPLRSEPPRSEPPRSEPPLPEPPRAERPQTELPLAQPPREATVAPISTALDAAAKLAADADAAAAALESLTRMLQAHRRPASTIPAPQDVAQRPIERAPRPAATEPMAPRLAAAETLAAQVNYAQAATRPDMPEHDPLQMAPRQPRPVQRPVQLVPKPTNLPEPLRPVRPPMLRPTPMARDSRQFDVRGFMAGFAFAWAIGAMIYIYLLAG